jgi:hypothetical protein
MQGLQPQVPSTDTAPVHSSARLPFSNLRCCKFLAKFQCEMDIVRTVGTPYAFCIVVTHRQHGAMAGLSCIAAFRSLTFKFHNCDIF